MSASVQNSDEAGLLSACRNGDTRAFEQLVLRYQRSLYNVAFRISGNEADAADIVQEAFLAAWRKIKEFREKPSFQPGLPVSR